MNVVLERGVGRVALEGMLRGDKRERASPWAFALLAAFRGCDMACREGVVLAEEVVMREGRLRARRGLSPL